MTIQEIKKSARFNLKGSYIKCSSTCLLYFIIIAILTYILNIIGLKIGTDTIYINIIYAIFGVISLVLSFGVIANVLSLSQNKTKSITKFIDNSILNFGKYTKIILQILIRILIPLFIFLLCLFYLIFTLIAAANKTNYLVFQSNLLPLAIIICLVSFLVLVYFLLKYTLSAFICISDSSLNSKEIVQKSAELMKGRKLKYIGLILSFFGWIILVSIILYILSYFIDFSWLTPIVIIFYTLIRPYVIESESIFYESIGEQVEKS